MVTSTDIGTWLQSLGLGQLVVGNVPQGAAAGNGAQIRTEMDEPPQPDRVILVTLTGGAPPSRERTFDHQSVQVRVRGRQNDQQDAEALAGQVDDAFLGAMEGIAVNGRRVLTINRVGGPPAFLQRDQARRTMLSCNYMLEVQRTVF